MTTDRTITRRTTLAGAPPQAPTLLERFAFADDDELVDFAIACRASIDHLIALRDAAQASALHGRAA